VSMIVTIKLFGPQADLAGAREVRVPLEGTPTVARLRAALAEACPALAPTLLGSRLAVNHEFAWDSEMVGENDEVALIGMVSGG